MPFYAAPKSCATLPCPDFEAGRPITMEKTDQLRPIAVSDYPQDSGETQPGESSPAEAGRTESNLPVKTPQPHATARLIKFMRGRHVALPPHVTLELVENPMTVAVPGGAYYAYGLLAWQGRQLPMIDLKVLLGADPTVELAAKPRYALVLAYQSAPHQPLSHGAIALSVLPETVAVTDEDACPLPNDSDLWPLLSHSCFRHNDQPVPILDTARLFDSYLG